MVSSFGVFTTAQGRWTRIDGGDPMAPGAVTIDCRSDLGRCDEVNVSVNDGWVTRPMLDSYPATFTTDQISYSNDDPICARYSVRIDLKLKKVFAVRERKADRTPTCASLEDRIEMTLGNGYQHDPNYYDKHFLPVIWIISRIF